MLKLNETHHSQGKVGGFSETVEYKTARLIQRTALFAEIRLFKDRFGI